MAEDFRYFTISTETRHWRIRIRERDILRDNGFIYRAKLLSPLPTAVRAVNIRKLRKEAAAI